LTPSSPGSIHPTIIEYEPIPLKPKPKPISPPHTSPTSPMAPPPAPDTVADPAATGRSAHEYATTLLLSPGQQVEPNEIRKGTQVYLIEKIKEDGSLKLSPPIKNPKITVTSGTAANTYEILIATKDASLQGALVYVTIILAAQGIAGVATDQFS